MKKTVWTFGLIAGAILSAMMVLNHIFMDEIGFDRAEIIGYTTMVVAFLLVFFGIRSYRDNVAGGSVSFGRALAVGSLIVLVASVFYVATWEVIAFKFDPDFVARYQAHAIEEARASGGSPQAVQQQVEQIQRMSEMLQNPAINAAVAFIEPLPVGLVMVLISAGILSRRRRRTDAELAPAVG